MSNDHGKHCFDDAYSRANEVVMARKGCAVNIVGKMRGMGLDSAS